MKKLENIYESSGKLCHFLIRGKMIDSGRQDMIDTDQPLQLSTLRMKKGDTFFPHMHVETIKTVNMTQESWVVIRGRVRVLYFDTAENLICDRILDAGDVTVTLYGGHTYESLEDDTVVYEFKTGPYLGFEKDKKRIKDPRTP